MVIVGQSSSSTRHNAHWHNSTDELNKKASNNNTWDKAASLHVLFLCAKKSNTCKDFKVFIFMYTVNAFMENPIKQIPGFKEKIKP